MEFRDRVVLITGAAEGIGAACARAFAERGARLSLVDLHRPADAIPACWTIGDVADAYTAERAMRRTLNAFGSIDILINNAGVGLYAGASDTSVEAARRIFDVNLFGAMRFTSLAIPHLRTSPSAAIVNIGSIGGLVSLPWCALYSCSKHALHAYTNSLRRELADEDIHVMTVVPGIVRTRFREHVLGGDPPQKVASLKWTISPDDLARSILAGVEKRKRFVTNPRVGLLFSALDFFFPWMMDWYCARQWERPTHRVSSEEVLAGWHSSTPRGRQS